MRPRSAKICFFRFMSSNAASTTMSTLVEAVVGGGRRDQGHRLLEGLRGHAALRHRRFVILANGGQASLDRRVVHVLEQHRNAGVRVGHGDAAAHGAGANHRGPLDLRHRRVFRHVGHLRGFAIGEEHVHQRARFMRRSRSRRTARARAPSPLSKSSVKAPSMASTALNGALTPFAVFASAARAAAHAATPACRSAILSVSSRVFRTLAVGGHRSAQTRWPRQEGSIPPDVIDDARRRRRGGHQRASRRAHFNRQLGAAQPRQALRAAGAGNDAEQHFRLADFRIGRHHAVVARHGDFKAAAKRVAVDRRHERLL